MSRLSNEISNESCAEISSRARTWSQSKSLYNMWYDNSWQIGYAHEVNAQHGEKISMRKM